MEKHFRLHTEEIVGGGRWLSGLTQLPVPVPHMGLPEFQTLLQSQFQLPANMPSKRLWWIPDIHLGDPG